MEDLEFHSERLVGMMRSDPAFVDVGTSWETGKPEIEIDVHRDRAADLGAPATVIGRTIRTLLADEELGAFVLAIAAIYMVLASLFNSLVHPITIMMSAPLSFIGAFLALKLADKPLDMMSGIGLLVLTGLVMKNGILLIDYINRRRQDGRSRREAILEAGPARLRPVLMTAFSLIRGLLPVAFSTASGSEARAAIAVLTMGGMATSTLLTLLVVPVIYDLVDRGVETVTAWSRVVWDRMVSLSRPPQETARADAPRRATDRQAAKRAGTKRRGLATQA